ncbi:hypothetical protein T492DRAFT_960763, partial [Pavlovales sp. CCMP2436]
LCALPLPHCLYPLPAPPLSAISRSSLSTACPPPPICYPHCLHPLPAPPV